LCPFDTTKTGPMPTDEDDQDGHFFFNHPERGGAISLPRRAQPLLMLLI